MPQDSKSKEGTDNRLYVPIQDSKHRDRDTGMRVADLFSTIIAALIIGWYWRQANDRNR